MNIAVVWASELRAASAACRAFQEAITAKASDEIINAAAQEMMLACHTALLGIENAPNIVVCDGDMLKFEPRITEVKRPKAKQEDDDGN